MSYVLNVNDCPLRMHNVVHDIVLFPKYCDPVYYPQFYPEILESPMSVKEWIESALNSHASACQGCLSEVEWSGFGYY